MLVPVQTSGEKPPLFFMHGLRGVMMLGLSFARVLGPDHPLYAIHANGIDGRQPVIDNMRDMVRAYVEQIQEARPTGPIRIGGMCEGTVATIEVARELQKRGRQIGPVILLDPAPMPSGYNKENHIVDPWQPAIARQLYAQARRELLDFASRADNDMHFDPSDPQQVHYAVLAGLGSQIAIYRHVPAPFSAPAQLILSAERAVRFFHPQMPWHRLLPGPRMVHVVPWDHMELFRSGRETVVRLLKFVLDETPMLAEQHTARNIA